MELSRAPAVEIIKQVSRENRFEYQLYSVRAHTSYGLPCTIFILSLEVASAEVSKDQVAA